MNQDAIYYRKQINLWFLGAFLMPPLAWLALGWYAQIWSFGELLQIVLSPNIWVYVAFVVSLVWFLLNRKLRVIDRYLETGGDKDLGKAQKEIRALPLFFSASIILYILIGPKVVLWNLDFLTGAEFWLAETTGLPIIFLFAAPFFIKYIANIERYAIGIPLSRNLQFMTLKGRLTMTLGFTVFGVIVLFLLFNISVLYANKTRTGEELLNIVLVKGSVAGFISLVVIGFNILLIIASVSSPIRNLEHQLSKMLQNIDRGEADLTVTFHTHSRDELGFFTDRLTELVFNLKSLIQTVKNSSFSLTDASRVVRRVSSEVADGAETMAVDASQVASASEELSVNMNTMASTSEQMSVNISSVASAAEQMSKNMTSVSATASSMSESMDQISHHSRNSSEIARNATELASIATGTMSTLGDAANEIGAVTDVIKSIAGKTNLLALNATIEAASAGDAGKGFAVVAFEIKELANQSARAAEDIARRIEDVQSNTQQAVKVITDVSEIITRINRAVDTINNQVIDQTGAMENISVNINETNRGIQNIARSVQELTVGSSDLSRNASEAARGTQTITQNIHTVSGSIRDNTRNASELSESAIKLFDLSQDLSTTVDRFVIHKKEEMKIYASDLEDSLRSLDELEHLVQEMVGSESPSPLPSLEETPVYKLITGKGKEIFKNSGDGRGLRNLYEQFYASATKIQGALQAGEMDQVDEPLEELGAAYYQLKDRISLTLRSIGRTVQNEGKAGA